VIFGLPGTYLLGTLVNKGKKKGQGPSPPSEYLLLRVLYLAGGIHDVYALVEPHLVGAGAARYYILSTIPWSGVPLDMDVVVAAIAIEVVRPTLNGVLSAPNREC
jgi:hypothetical protein